MSAFSPRQMFLLDHACKPLHEAFDCLGVFLVGTAATRQSYRDVDVRMMLTDKTYDRMLKVMSVEGMAFLGLAIGQYLASMTGLPIDFQIQRQTQANEHHAGTRNPLGLRPLWSYSGDAVPARATQLRVERTEMGEAILVQPRDHALIADAGGDPACTCGYKPAPPEVRSQLHAALLVRKHIEEHADAEYAADRTNGLEER